MAGTRIQQRINDYNRLFIEDAKEAANGPYGEVLKKLKTLVSKTEELYTPDPSGQFKKMDEKEYHDMIEAYQEVQQECKNYGANWSKMNDFEKSRYNIVKRLNHYINTDLNFLTDLDVKNLPSLSDAVKEARSKKVYLPEKAITKVGAAQSCRIPMKTADGKKGYFTAKTEKDRDAGWKEILDNCQEYFPSKYWKRLQEIKTNEKIRDNYIMYFPFYKRTKYEKKDLEEDRKYLIKLILPEADLKKEEKSLNIAMQKMLENSYNWAKDNSMLTVAGVPNKRRLDQRNSAMYRMAELIGSPELVAKAVPMTVVIGGKEVKGTFMENVEGFDCINYKSKSENRRLPYTREAFMNPKALKQMGELQVIDYLCGNTDRHSGNMIYQFQKDEEGKLLLSQIVGIDNDCSFGKENKEKYIGVKLANIDKMHYISDKHASRILNMTPDAIKLTLADHEFTKEEMDAACTRLTNLQTAIREKKVEVMKDGDWIKLAASKERIDKLVEEKRIFAMVSGVQTALQKLYEKTRKNPIAQIQDQTFASGSRAEDFQAGYQRMKELAKKMHSYNHNLYINSSKFNCMKNAVYAIEKYSNKLNQKCMDANRKPNAEEMKKLGELYQKLGEASQEYIKAKDIAPESGHGQRRLELANDLKDLSLDVCGAMQQEEKTAENDAGGITI